MSCDEVRASLAAYSLNALEADEQAEVAAHLDQCVGCATEAAALADIAAGLGRLVPPAAPPPALRARVLAEAAAENRRRPWLRLVAWRPPPSALAAAIAVGSLAWAVTLQVQLSQQNERLATLARRAERYERVVSVLRAGDLRVRDLAGTPEAPGARGRVVVDPAGQSGMLMVWDLPPVPADRAYQVWFVSEEGRHSAGVVRPDERGNGYFFIEVPPDLTPYRSIGLTDEPASGSPGPTGQRVLGGAL